MKKNASKSFFGLSLIAFATINAQQKSFAPGNQIKKIDSYLNAAPPSQYAVNGTAINKSSVTKVSNNDNFGEAEEFKQLMAETSAVHKDKTVTVLNALFDQDVNSKNAILLVQNNSDCDMIVRIQGAEKYKLAVPAHGENSIVLKKDSYQLKSNVCDAQYASTKDLWKGMVVTLNHTTNPANRDLAMNKE